MRNPNRRKVGRGTNAEIAKSMEFVDTHINPREKIKQTGVQYLFRQTCINLLHHVYKIAAGNGVCLFAMGEKPPEISPGR
jgi:hypothetical protein